MSIAATKEAEIVQSDLKKLGFYDGDVDGKWGKNTQAAWDKAVACMKQATNYQEPPEAKYDIIWSAKVSELFVSRTKKIAETLRLPLKDYQGAEWLMACMAFETGETFSPSIQNGAGAPYYGLIQFGNAAAKSMGTTTDALRKMSAEDQLEYVYQYLKPWAGKINSLSDLYMCILWPAAVGRSEDWVLWDKETRPTTYSQNRGLDGNKNGEITKGEATYQVQLKMERGKKFRRELK